MSVCASPPSEGRTQATLVVAYGDCPPDVSLPEASSKGSPRARGTDGRRNVSNGQSRMEGIMRGLLVCIFICVVAGPAHTQHLGVRQQWQPQTESDPRLRQPVEIEIIGRAAVTGLPILSEKTGVSFSVAPEDLATVGERKFTVIAKGLELKSIMVQLCEALQECHWDVDASGPELTYWLHRNSDAQQLIALSSGNPSYWEWSRTQERLRTLERVRRALQMSPEELLELEKTDLIIARTLRFAPLRGMVEGVLSLPPDRMEELLRAGQIGVEYEGAPARLQKAAQLFSRYAVEISQHHWWEHADLPIHFDEERPEREWPRSFSALIYLRLDSEGVSFTLFLDDTEALASGTQVQLMAECPPPPPSGGRSTGWGQPWQHLFLATGSPDYETACQQLRDVHDLRGQEQEQAEQEAKERRRAEILDPVLQQTITLDEEWRLPFSQFLQELADKAGVPVLSDCFTLTPVYIPEEAEQALPVWRLLDLVCEQREYQWQKVGECLVFHHARWYAMIAREIPRSLLLAYRKKLDEQGQFTLEDVAAFAVAMAKAPGVNLPMDFQAAGLVPIDPFGFLSLFRVPISPDQLSKARSPEGLSLQDMTPAQQQQLPGILESCGYSSAAEFQNITLAIRESPYGSKEEGGTEVELELDLWRVARSPIGNHESFRLPRREKDDSSNAPAEERE